MERAYGGRSAADRRSERRARLLEAGLAIWGEQGWAAVTVRGVCARAGLIDRYFYESFPDREALLLSVFDQVSEEAWTTITQAWEGTSPDPAERGRATLAAFVHQLEANPAIARVALAEPAGSPALEKRRRDTFEALARFMVDSISELLGGLSDEDRRKLEIAALFCVGGMVELATTWLNGYLKIEPDELVERCTTMFSAAMTAGLVPEP